MIASLGVGPDLIPIVRLFTGQAATPPHEVRYSGDQYAVRGWTADQWAALPECDRPVDAAPLGPMMVLLVINPGKAARARLLDA